MKHMSPILLRASVRTPCQGCGKRRVDAKAEYNCHDHCEMYIKYKESLEQGKARAANIRAAYVPRCEERGRPI